MIEQLLLHVVGDYITQTNKMASKKITSWLWALTHATVYSLPFLLIGSIDAVLVIGVTHAVIDRYRLARYVVFAKNWITETSLKWGDCSKTGYPSSLPDWLAVWLLIIADNVMHVAINYASLRFL